MNSNIVNMEEKILTKKYIEGLGYEVEEVSYRIFLVKNFLLEEELINILNIIKSLSQEDWEGDYMKSVKEMALKKFGRSDVNNLIKEGLYEVTNNWYDKSFNIKDYNLISNVSHRAQEIFNFKEDLLFNGFATIQRQYEGTPLVEHFDNKTDNSLEYASVVYLNNNYTGGEIYFKHQKLYLKPPTKSMLIFPTTEKWTHGVTEVGPGPERYVVPCFISKKNFWTRHRENNYNLDKTLKNI